MCSTNIKTSWDASNIIYNLYVYWVKRICAQGRGIFYRSQPLFQNCVQGCKLEWNICFKTPALNRSAYVLSWQLILGCRGTDSSVSVKQNQFRQLYIWENYLHVNQSTTDYDFCTGEILSTLDALVKTKNQFNTGLTLYRHSSKRLNSWCAIQLNNTSRLI